MASVVSVDCRCLSAPLAGDGNSTLALSVSNTQSGSSRSTRSPSPLSHSRRMTSLTDSPMLGISTCTDMQMLLTRLPPLMQHHFAATA